MKLNVGLGLHHVSHDFLGPRYTSVVFSMHTSLLSTDHCETKTQNNSEKYQRSPAVSTVNYYLLIYVKLSKDFPVICFCKRQTYLPKKCFITNVFFSPDRWTLYNNDIYKAFPQYGLFYVFEENWDFWKLYHTVGVRRVFHQKELFRVFEVMKDGHTRKISTGPFSCINSSMTFTGTERTLRSTKWFGFIVGFCVALSFIGVKWLSRKTGFSFSFCS